MLFAGIQEEKKRWKRGLNFVVGLDEAGRGPLAGPVVAAAVCLQKGFSPKLLLRDSKKLSEKQREHFYEKLTNHEKIQWAVGVVSEEKIDEINILQATKLAMKQAILSLTIKPDFLLLDGNFALPVNVAQESIIGGDGTVFSCAAAGIIAKVTRDKMMKELHQQYPEYGFDKHKGYGTKLHLKQLASFGPCKIHRKTFYPISTLAERGNM